MMHTYEKHKNCMKQYCPICDGGLAHCIVCGGFEGGLPTECPGSKMTFDLQHAVYEGEIDFMGGKWVCDNSKCWERRIFGKEASDAV